ncbi:hypothetical protein B0H17DRAFT_1136049 [Mycena rosella]|uniref:F-box domain-containing protein n=1 Tax=Mycena rosella TaxID=1033263 RepID=A0AAD7DEN6_MYCRO|nr:hypothetical protein B0H17DRAFT_1136049 [Mycena rosella]
MSIAELQCRIDKLSADIIRQKEVLTNLERSKSGAQRQLNAFRDPMARLPLEISSEIFVLCLGSSLAQTRARCAPMLLLNICNGWTDIALCNTALWDSIHLHQPPAHLASLLDAWLKRSGSRVLSISLPVGITDEISPVIVRHAHQLRDLKMYQDITFVAAGGPFPLLTTLTIAGVEEFSSRTSAARQNFLCSASATLGMLGLCPNLVECTFDNANFDRDYAGEILVHSHMQHLKFGKYPHWSGDSILRHLSLPALETLSISFFNLRLEDLLQFTRRSSPPLQKLILCNVVMAQWSGSLPEMEGCLSLLVTALPMLMHRELLRSRSSVVPNHFLTILANSPHLLPNLSTLIFEFANPSYEKLSSALCARRT